MSPQRHQLDKEASRRRHMTTEGGKSLAKNLKSSTDHRTRDMFINVQLSVILEAYEEISSKELIELLSSGLEAKEPLEKDWVLVSAHDASGAQKPSGSVTQARRFGSLLTICRLLWSCVFSAKLPYQVGDVEGILERTSAPHLTGHQGNPLNILKAIGPSAGIESFMPCGFEPIWPCWILSRLLTSDVRGGGGGSEGDDHCGSAVAAEIPAPTEEGQEGLLLVVRRRSVGSSPKRLRKRRFAEAGFSDVLPAKKLWKGHPALAFALRVQNSCVLEQIRRLVLGDGILGKRDVLRMRATLRLTLLYGLPHVYAI
ncbi:hypothetical protein Tco_0196713 [Tanacetum coccineum]